MPITKLTAPATAECVVDYDGCVGNNPCEKKSAAYLMQINFTLLQHMSTYLRTKTNGLPDNNRCISIGTARQSKFHDDYAADYNQSTCAFPIYPVIRAVLDDVVFDDFLLADVNQGLDDGASYQYAMDPNYSGPHAEWSEDRSKISILYAKIHRAASFNPNGPVFVAFYDDNTDILAALKHFFSVHAYLIPENVVLDLYQFKYGALSVKPIASLSGNHESLGIDKNYRKTVQFIGQIIDQNKETEVDEQGYFYDLAASIPTIFRLNLADEITAFRTDSPRPRPQQNFLREALTFFGCYLGDCLPSLQTPDTPATALSIAPKG